MKEISNILFLGIISTFIFGCSNKSVEPLQNINIDAGPFSVTVPSNFELVKEKGIDSYVGKITNGKIEFNFDYGWYSNMGPLTYYDYVDKYMFRLHKDLVVSTCEISDSIFQSLRENLNILDARRNPQYPDNSDKEISTTISVGTGTCTIYLFNMIGDISMSYENYSITESATYDIRRKDYYPISKEVKKAGVYIEKLDEKRDNKYGHNKLSFITHDYEAKNAKLILEILKTVQLKENQ